jgi:HK97 family phage major capsid protein
MCRESFLRSQKAAGFPLLLKDTKTPMTVRGISEKERNLKEQRVEAWQTMTTLVEKMENGRKLTRTEVDDFDAAQMKYQYLGHELDLVEKYEAGPKSKQDLASQRGLGRTYNADRPGVPVNPYTGDSRTEGYENEPLRPDQSMSEWRSRALENGVKGVRNDGTDRDMNRYWAERMGLSKPTIETRALQEDISSGVGAAQAIVPQQWSTDFIDAIRPRLLMSQAGATILPLATEQTTIPQLLTDPAPVWLGEMGSNSVDNTSKFGPLLFNATGAYSDILQISRQVAEDTNQQGGLQNLMQSVLSAKYARLIDQVALFGTAGNAGNPGMANEAGLIYKKLPSDVTSGILPTDTTFLSSAAQAVRVANSEVSAFVTNPQVVGTMQRMNASTYANYWHVPPGLEDVPILYSTTQPAIETDPALGTIPAETGGTMSSLWAGDWSRVYVGIRIDLDITVLDQLYASVGAIGLWSYMRFSIRTVHPETFVRYQGILTTS